MGNNLEIMLKSGRKIEVNEFQAYYELPQDNHDNIRYLNHQEKILTYLKTSDNPIIIQTQSYFEMIPKISIESIKFYIPAF